MNTLNYLTLILLSITVLSFCGLINDIQLSNDEIDIIADVKNIENNSARIKKYLDNNVAMCPVSK